MRRFRRVLWQIGSPDFEIGTPDFVSLVYAFLIIEVDRQDFVLLLRFMFSFSLYVGSLQKLQFTP